MTNFAIAFIAVIIITIIVVLALFHRNSPDRNGFYRYGKDKGKKAPYWRDDLPYEENSNFGKPGYRGH